MPCSQYCCNIEPMLCQSCDWTGDHCPPTLPCRSLLLTWLNYSTFKRTKHGWTFAKTIYLSLLSWFFNLCACCCIFQVKAAEAGLSAAQEAIKSCSDQVATYIYTLGCFMSSKDISYRAISAQEAMTSKWYHVQCTCLYKLNTSLGD